MKGAAAHGLIGGVDFGGAPAAVAAKDNPGRPAPGGQARRVALPTAVVRGQKGVAGHGLVGQQLIESGRFQVAGQENAMAEVFQHKHEAVGIVVALGTGGRGMQDFYTAIHSGVEPIAGADFTDRHMGLFKGRF